MTEEKSYQQMRREFQEAFFKQISPQLMIYEKERKNHIIIACIVTAFILLVGFFALFFMFIPGFIIMCSLAFSSWHFTKKIFENTIKEKCMPIICKCFGNLEWSSGDYCQTIDNIYSDSNLLYPYNRSKYDDIFQGTHKNVEFEIIETEFRIKEDKSDMRIFKGVVLKLKMNKNFSGNTVILPNSSLHITPSLQLVHTILEDIKFEKEYDVFTDDEVEARYLITPTFMERLKNIKTAFFATEVRCAFYNEYLLIGLSTGKDLFSICSLTKPVNDPKQFFTMYEEIISIIKLIDHFKLDQKIGL